MTDYIWAYSWDYTDGLDATLEPVLLLSDIHGNLPALEAVLEDAEARGGYSAVWVLGDSVGYGAQPNEVVERLRALPGLSMVKGNHEAAALGEITVADFNPVAGAATVWTAKNLRQEVRDFLRVLPEVAIDREVTLCHGAPRDPMWEYMLSVHTAEGNLDHFDTAGCVHGHTHVPSIFGCYAERSWHAIQGHDQQIEELDYRRWFVNPGSVGQPRDGDPRASYALLRQDQNRDVMSVHFHRVEYDVALAQQLIIEAGLPLPLAFRLSEGQ